MPERSIPKSEKLEQMLTSLHTQLYVLHSQVAAWQSASASFTRANAPDAKTKKAFSLMEECCRMDWKIGQSLLAILHSVWGKGEQRGSSPAALMGTGLPMLSNSLPKPSPVRHPSAIVAATACFLSAN